MYQFFVEEENVSGTEIIIRGSDVRYIRNVIRLRCGEQIRVSTPSENYLGRIGEVSEHFVRVQIVADKIGGTELSSHIVLFQGLPKGDKMELIVQKAVELGVSGIVPVAMKHCVVRLDDKKAKAKSARWQSIAENAARQAKRSMIPRVTYPMEFAQAADAAMKLDHRLVPYENENGMRGTKEALSRITPGSSVGIFIGPEGGFAAEEIAMVKDRMRLISLGKRILRTETAGIAALAVLMYHLETEQEEWQNAGISG